MLKKKIPQRITSTLLAFAMVITSIPFMSWTAIASTIVPAVLAAEDDSVAGVSADSTVSQTGDNVSIVQYPTTADGYTYTSVDNTVIPADWATTYQSLYDELAQYMCVFDVETYAHYNTDLFYPNLSHNTYGEIDHTNKTVTYNEYQLFVHWYTSGIKEGRLSSPFFCIDCYYCHNEETLYTYCVNAASDKTYGSAEYYQAIRQAAWDHFYQYRNENQPRYLSPLMDVTYYKNKYENEGVAAAAGTKDVLHHALNKTNGTVLDPNKLWSTSSKVDHIGYFFHNSTVFYNKGVMECYRKMFYDLTESTNTIGRFCYRHNDKSYQAYQTFDNFTATITNLGTKTYLGVNGTTMSADIAYNEDAQLWQFEKQADGTYIIYLVNPNGGLTYEGGSPVIKYLSASDSYSPVPTYWYLYRKDGAYILKQSFETSKVLNVSDQGQISATVFNNPSTANGGYSLNKDTLNQMFVINTTYSSTADSDELSEEFDASIDAFNGSDWNNTKLGHTQGDTVIRSRMYSDASSLPADMYWHFDRNSDGTYSIKNIASGLYLDSSDSGVDVFSSEHYATFTKQRDEKSEFQKWVLRKRDGGGYFIMPFATLYTYDAGTYLTRSDDGTAALNQYLFYCRAFETDRSPSIFDITVEDKQTTCADLTGINGEFYAYISSAKTGLGDFCLKNNATAYGTTMKLEQTQSSNRKKHNMYWKFERTPDGAYTITSTTVLDAYLTVTNGKVTLEESNKNEANWYVTEYDGGFRIQDKASGLYLTMDEDGNLSLVQRTSYNNNDLQLFKITQTDMSVSTSADDTFKMSIFNYGSRINETGNENNPAVLDFYNGNNDALDAVNSNVGPGDGVVPEMSKVLDENDYPYVNHYAYVYSESAASNQNSTPDYFTSGSLQYLFDKNSGYVTGSGNNTADVYNPAATNGDEYQSMAFNVQNPSGLFQKDADGYYYYDSSEYSAYFDTDANKFKVYDYVTHPQGYAPLVHKDFQGMFLPFNIPHEDGVLSYDGTQEHTDNEPVNYDCDGSTVSKANYVMPQLNRENGTTTGDRSKAIDMWFGMTLETDFYQTQGGKLNGQEVKFEFAGDDDVWVYLDGILALDIGNTHGVINGEINFAQSTVTRPVKTDYMNTLRGETTTITYPGDDEVVAQMWEKNDGEFVTETVSLYSVYYDAYEEVTGDKKAEIEETIKRSFEIDGDTLPQPEADYTDDPQLKDYAEHNLKFFYLERGAGASNCKIKFNTFSGATNVSKEVEGLNTEIAENTLYKFQALYVDENGEETPVENSPYTVSSTDGVALIDDGVNTVSDDNFTDKNGYFTLHANEKATFTKIPLGSKIKIKEIISDNNVTSSWRTLESGVEVLNKAGSETDDITVPVDGTLDIVFTNKYTSKDISIEKIFDDTGAQEGYKPSESQLYKVGYQIFDNNGEQVLKEDILLYNEQVESIKDIPVGYTYSVWEYTPVTTLSFESPMFSVDGSQQQTKLFVPQGAYPGSSNYFTATVNNNSQNKVTITNKLIERDSITVTFKYYDRKRVSGALAQIDSEPTTYKKTLSYDDWKEYFVNETQRMNFEELITDYAVNLNETVLVDNIIDEYVFWPSQQQAVVGISKEKDYASGKTDGSYQTYGDTTSASELAYHTDAFGKNANDGEKWITYYQGGQQIDPEKQGNDSKVTAITVWLFNKPKEYTATLHTIDPANLSTVTRTGDMLIGNDEMTFSGFYNQRIANDPVYDDADFDSDNAQKYLDAYQIPESDIIKGEDAFGNEVPYISIPSTVVDTDSDNSEPYTFHYWSYDPQGRFVASTSINYAYRITNDIELYAVYGKGEFDTPGVTAFQNGYDYYRDMNGTLKVRLNTMLTPYNCVDNDETITDAAIMYVMLHGADKYKNYTQDQLLAKLSETTASGATHLDNLRSSITTILANNKTKGSAYVVDVTVTANGFKYSVEASNGTDSSKINLTSKNRMQFVTEFTKSTLDGKRMLAFTAMKKDGNWLVSDNYVDYDFLNN